MFATKSIPLTSSSGIFVFFFKLQRSPFYKYLAVSSDLIGPLLYNYPWNPCTIFLAISFSSPKLTICHLPQGMEISVNPNRTFIPPGGITTSPIKVKANGSAELGLIDVLEEGLNDEEYHAWRRI
jgi:hypothetical protein